MLREPAVAGAFYPDNPEDLKAAIEDSFLSPFGVGKIPEDVLRKLNPKIIVIGEAPSEDLNYYNNYNTITQNSAGDITFECEDNKVHIYVSSDSYMVDYLENDNHPSSYGKYIGTLKV